MSPVGIQRAIAIIVFLSPWIFVSGVFKDILFVLSGILLFVSTFDLKKRPRINFEDPHEENHLENKVNS